MELLLKFTDTNEEEEKYLDSQKLFYNVQY